MSTAIAKQSNSDAVAVLEQVVVGGDLARLTPADRVAYYKQVCESIGLNPFTRPFEYIVLNDKLTLYARKDATDQLRKNGEVSVEIVSREVTDGVYIVTARASNGTGRMDESIGAVPLIKEAGEWKQAQSGKRYFAGNGTFVPLSPDDRANAIMKAETKAKRRVTLSFCGLGWTDESELETIPSVRTVEVDAETGEIKQPTPQGRTSTADRVQQHMANNGQPHPVLNPANPPTATAADFARAAKARGFEERTSKSKVQAFIEEIAPDYEGRPYSLYTGEDWKYLISCIPPAPPAEGEEPDPFADTPEEIAAREAAVPASV
jgi:hypothetical protein